MIEYIIDEFEENVRLDRLLRRLYNLPQNLIERSMRTRNITVNDEKVTSNYRLKNRDVVKVAPAIINEPTSIEKPKQVSAKLVDEIKSRIIFRNDQFIVINKPQGIAVQGGSKIKTSLDDVLPRLDPKAKLIHRLDKETTGILLIAITSYAAAYLAKLFRENKIKKTYLAVLVGVPKAKSGRVVTKNEKQIGEDNYEKVSAKGLIGKTSITDYKVISSTGRYSLVEFKPLTGRTHQIRVHALELGAPILGDDKYGKRNELSNKLHLHAHKIKFEFELPNKEKIAHEFMTDLPDHMGESCRKLGLNSGN